MTADSGEVDRTVFGATIALLLGVSVPLMLAPEAGERAVQGLFDGITTQLGVAFVWAAIANLAFLGWIALGRYGRTRLSLDDTPPDFSTFSWAAMLFCAGIGTGILYWSTIEWAYYYDAPPMGAEPHSTEAIEWATAYPLFHWGLAGWAFYCLPALAIGHAYYCQNVGSMRISETCRSLVGDRADGPIGTILNLLFMVGLLGAAGTGIGLAVPLISTGLASLLDLADSFGLRLAVVVAVTLTFATSVWFGLERGIQRLSQANVAMTLVLLAFVLVAGPTRFILETGTTAVGHGLQNFVRMLFWTDPVLETGFVESWTVFYWAWWIALGPYMGMFIARISRGRTLREVVFGVLGFGSAGCALFFVAIGNYALHLELTGALAVTRVLEIDGPSAAIIAVFRTLPFEAVVLGLFCLVSLVFMATTYDSAAYTLALGSTRRLEIGRDPPRWHRLFWACAISILPVTLMFLGGLTALQTASIVVSVPLLGVGVLMAAALVRALRSEAGAASVPRRLGLALLLSAAAAPLAPAGAQEPSGVPGPIRRQADIMVAMRDGVRLATDVYFPAGQGGPMPTILMRTPYGKDLEYPYGGTIPMLVEAGYAFVFQDTRGRYGSEGNFTVRLSDRADGYDTVDWIVAQPWSDGQVATFGCSYRGETQITLAALRHPNHVAMLAGAPSAGYDPGGRPWTAFDGGVFELAQTAGWFIREPDADRASAYATLPATDVLRALGQGRSDFDDYVSSHPAGAYFQTLDFVRQNDAFDVPSIYIDSWYDFGVAETLRLFNQQRERAVSERARENQYVIITPSTHCAWTRPSNDRAGDRHVGDWRLDFEALYLRWYRAWLEGSSDDIDDLPRVQYYLMGANEWRSADAWPVPGTTYEHFYLSSGGSANTLGGDGTLSRTPPGAEPTDAFTYDPSDPVPTLGGQTCCTGLSTGAGGYDQTRIEQRDDVLVYTSPVLEEGLEVTGPLEVVLYVESDAPDTDFTAKLVDVDPAGIAWNVQEGAMRMRYRESLTEETLMRPGEVYEIRLDLHATSNWFGPGHRIRLEVSSSNFPRWSRNLNTGADNHATTEWRAATNTVHHSRRYPSRLILPVVR